MAEPSPDISERTLSRAEQEAQCGDERLLLSARIGEAILTFLGRLGRPASSLMSRQQAVTEGVLTAFARVLLGVVLIGACILVTVIYSGAAANGTWGPRLPWDRGLEEGLMMIAWLIAAGGALIVSWTDWDQKWSVLSWLCFALVASGTLASNGSRLGVLALLTGQFAIHWFVHAALRERDRRAEWERETESARQNAERPRRAPNLAHRYSGHAGFSKTTDDEQS